MRSGLLKSSQQPEKRHNKLKGKKGRQRAVYTFRQTICKHVHCILGTIYCHASDRTSYQAQKSHPV